MVEFKIKKLIIQVTPKNIKIKNSYLIQNKKEMKEIILEILEKASLYNKKRSINSLVREWRCHNRIYKLGLFVSHTKDCDLESNEALYRRIFYFFFGRF